LAKSKKAKAESKMRFAIENPKNKWQIGARSIREEGKEAV